MDIEPILAQLLPIFRRELDDDSIALRPETTAKDVPGWDSLTHIQLVVAIERQFKIKFTAAEIRSLANVGEMCELVRRRLPDAA
jgi:acyl carrier protein